MPKIITEDMIEQAAIKALHERHDYTVLNCMTEEPDTLPDGTGRKDKKQVVLPDVMLESLCRINPNIPDRGPLPLCIFPGGGAAPCHRSW